MREMMRSWARAAAVGALLAGGVPAGVAASPAATTSAVGSEAVPGIAVSAAYARTGFAVAMTYQVSGGCGQNCVHLWATRDRGATWTRLPATGWQHGLPSIALAPDGHEVLLAGGSVVQRSDDGGATWRGVVPSQGSPAAGRPFSADGTLAVAGQGGQDLLVRSSGDTTPVPGSGGALSDVQFAYAPDFPQAGAYAPLLLSAMNAKTGTTVVEQCTTAYACSSPVALPSTDKMPGSATLVVSPGYTSDGTVFAVLPTALLRSTDGGHSFTPVSIGPPGATATSVGSLVLDPGFARTHVAYAAVLQIVAGKADTRGGVYRTSDGGSTWSPVGSPGPLDHGATSVAVAPDGRVFAGFIDQRSSAEGMLCWAGSSWSASCGGTPAGPLSGHAGNVASATTPAATSPCASCGHAPAAAASDVPSQTGAGSGGPGAAAITTQPVEARSTGSVVRQVLLPAALALLGLVGAATLVARVRERRRQRS
jgi:photosystem II stability/assembly factor-like uncharacterized protein